MGREVSENCVDSLLTEMVSSYCDRFYANKPDLAARRIEAIGFQGSSAWGSVYMDLKKVG